MIGNNFWNHTKRWGKGKIKWQQLNVRRTRAQENIYKRARISKLYPLVWGKNTFAVVSISIKLHAFRL